MLLTRPSSQRSSPPSARRPGTPSGQSGIVCTASGQIRTRRSRPLKCDTRLRRMPSAVVPPPSGVNTTSPRPCRTPSTRVRSSCGRRRRARRCATRRRRGVCARSSSVSPGAGDRRNVSSAQRPSGRIRSSTSAAVLAVPASCACTKRCSSAPPAAGRNSTSRVKRDSPPSGLAATTSPSSTPSNSTAAPPASSTTRGAPTTSTAWPPMRARLSMRHSTGAPAALASIRLPDGRRGQRRHARGHGQRGAEACSRHAEGADQHPHVADVGLDRDAHQRGIGVGRGVERRRRRESVEKSPAPTVSGAGPRYG